MLPLAGEVGETLRPPGTPSRQTSQAEARLRQYLAAGLRRSGELFRSGRYTDANLSLQRDYEAARQARQYDLAAKLLANSGGCRFALHQYREALQAFGEAERLALFAGNTSAAGVIDTNISSIYEQMGDLEASAAYVSRGAARLKGGERKAHLPKLLVQLASLRARQGRVDEARRLFSEGISAADAAGDADTYALGWDRMGEEAIKRGELAEAERAFLEAWRVRKLHRLAALGTSYRNLGRLRLAQGDLRSAQVLLDQAVASARAPRGLMPTWDSYHARGLARLAGGRPAAALDDLRVAVRLARAWRAGASPSDASRASIEQLTEPVHASLARAAATIYLQTGRPELLEESFEAVEENRAMSLRALLDGGPERRQQLPPGYWETLARLQSCEVALVRRPDDAGRSAEVEALRASLAEMENRTTPIPVETGRGLLARLRRSLPADAAYFCLQPGEPESYLWSVDRTGAALYTLPGRKELATAGARFAAAVLGDSGEADKLGSRLYDSLLGRVAPRFKAHRRWLVALDEELSAAPLAAMRENGRYVVERHTIQMVSSAALVASSRPENWSTRLAGNFLGVGDPVYNTADARWEAPAKFRFGLLQAQNEEAVQLPRLAGSAREVRACAGEWERAGAMVLEGPEVCKARLRAALATRPAVAHLATHVIPSAQRAHYGLIALSLTGERGAEMLGPAEIAAWDVPVGLVTLSGCSSGVGPAQSEAKAAQQAWLRSLGFSAGSGPALPDRGLVGLTRAWLAAGAGAVAATRWPVRDSDGTLLQLVYRKLREEPDAGPAAALARAQAEMLQSGGWRSRPQYWGAYFVVSNQ